MKTTNNKSERANAIQSLREANKEVKSLSGVIKLLQKFWSNGYKEAFNYLGISYKDLDFKVISAMCQKNEDSQIYLTSKKHKTNKAGQKVFTPTLTTSGKNKGRVKDVAVYEDVHKVITTWSATTLFKVLEQSKQK